MLKTSRLTVSPIKKNDLSFFRNLRNDQDTAFFLTQMSPINEYMQEEWFEGLALDTTKMYFTITADDKNVGIIRCDEWDKINQSIRVGIDIVPEYRRNGYAREVYDMFIPYLFQNLHIHRIWLLVAEYNATAITLYKKIGFGKEGAQRDAIFRDGKYHDYLMMSLLSTQYEKK